jgi:hypothetical protein
MGIVGPGDDRRRRRRASMAAASRGVETFLSSSDSSSSLIDSAEMPSLMAWINFRISRSTAAIS